MEFQCARPNRCLQHVQNHGFDLSMWEEKLHHLIPVVAREIDGLIQRRSAVQVWSACKTRGSGLQIAGARLRALVISAPLTASSVFFVGLCLMLPLVSRVDWRRLRVTPRWNKQLPRTCSGLCSLHHSNVFRQVLFFSFFFPEITGLSGI